MITQVEEFHGNKSGDSCQDSNIREYMSFADRNRAHDSLHYLIAIGEPLNLALVPDISCLICYPIEEEFEHPENFDDFWSWYRLHFKATQYSKQTTDLFTELRTSISEFIE